VGRAMAHADSSVRTPTDRTLPLKVSILTAGRDPYYALGLLSGLLSSPLRIDFVANDEMQDAPAARAESVRYWNVHPDQAAGAPTWRRVIRAIGHYVLLLRYAATTDSSLFHILWYNKLEWFDNTFLILYYKALRKRLVLTVHNVNTKERDGKNDIVNRLSLRFLYRHVDHIFVHTEQMKAQLCHDFSVGEDKVTVIPFGVNSFLFQSSLSPESARERLGVMPTDKVLLFFGNIAPYKGLDILIDALEAVPGCRLIIAGPVKEGCDDYWRQIERAIAAKGLTERVLQEVGFIPEENVEIYFKAAHVAVLPYRTISQSGVLFLSYNFGLPVIASDVGGLSESVKEGVTGYVCRPEDPADLARTIALYFDSELFKRLEERRETIIRDVNQSHSWNNIGEATCRVYTKVARLDRPVRSRKLKTDTLVSL
jgi:glycosyltransferase involved in cell wall biosynthesis